MFLLSPFPQVQRIQKVHEERIIHRDIKPDNIMLANGDTVKLADLGISKTFDEIENEDSGKYEREKKGKQHIYIWIAWFLHRKYRGRSYYHFTKIIIIIPTVFTHVYKPVSDFRQLIIWFLGLRDPMTFYRKIGDPTILQEGFL